MPALNKWQAGARKRCGSGEKDYLLDGVTGVTASAVLALEPGIYILQTVSHS